VFGAGTIGILIGLWLKALDAGRVTMVDLRPERLNVARAVGLTETVDLSTRDVDAGGDYQHSFEAAGAQAALCRAVESTRREGTITIIGRDTRDTTLPLKTVELLMRKELTLQGCWGYDMRGEREFVFRLLSQGCFPLAPLITRVVPLADAPGVIAGMIDGTLQAGKVLLSMREDE
jgi:threonine dehydrogenase-like Zn-dependent dehydrogenase